MKPGNARRLAILWTLLILAACSVPGRDIPSVQVVNIDKFVHVTFFALFGWLWMYAAVRLPLKKRVLTVVLCGLGFAVGTELYQGLLPWERTPDPLDALADAAGLAGAVALFVWRRMRDARSL